MHESMMDQCSNARNVLDIFFTKFSLNKHGDEYHGELRHRCVYCETNLSNQRHTDLHGDPPFKCDICEKGFAYRVVYT